MHGESMRWLSTPAQLVVKHTSYNPFSREVCFKIRASWLTKQPCIRHHAHWDVGVVGGEGLLHEHHGRDRPPGRAQAGKDELKDLAATAEVAGAALRAQRARRVSALCHML